MMSNNNMDDFNEDINWNVYKYQNNLKNKDLPVDNENENENFTIGNPNLVSTIAGRLPKNITKESLDSMAKEMINVGLSGPLPTKAIGQIAEKGYDVGKSAAKKALDYVNPKMISEELRNKFGEGSVSENIEKIGNRLKLAKKSAQEEALEPKKEFMQGLENKPLRKDYAETSYRQSKTVQQADKEMSDLKDEIRKLELPEKKGTIGDVSQKKLDLARAKLDKLKEEWKRFVDNLPENKRGKYDKFLKKYAINVGPYEDASFIIRKLVRGEYTGIPGESIDRLFNNANPKKEVLKIIKDIGPSGWNNLVYNMLSKFEPGEVSKMVKAIKSGYRKGSPIITKEMVNFADEAYKRAFLSQILKVSAGAAIGGSIFGPTGFLVGASSPYLKDILSKSISKFRK